MVGVSVIIVGIIVIVGIEYSLINIFLRKKIPFNLSYYFLTQKKTLSINMVQHCKISKQKKQNIMHNMKKNII